MKNRALALWSAARQRRFPFISSASDSPFRRDFVIINNRNFVHAKSVNALHTRLGKRSLEPRRRTPRILICDWNDSVAHWVLVNVIQARQVRALVGETAFPIVMPDLSRASTVKTVNPGGGLGVQFAENVRQISGAICGWAVSNEVIVIGKNGPGFQVPSGFCEEFQEAALQDGAAVGAAEVMRFPVGAGRDKVGAGFGELVGGGVGPGWGGCRTRGGRLLRRGRRVHAGMLGVWAPKGKRRCRAALQSAGARGELYA
jgi:hypothetical protein